MIILDNERSLSNNKNKLNFFFFFIRNVKSQRREATIYYKIYISNLIF